MVGATGIEPVTLPCQGSALISGIRPIRLVLIIRYQLVVADAR